MGTVSGRSRSIDVARGIGVWLVIWGHVIQYCYAGNKAFFENIVFRFIYGFHMPFFMIISGWLFWDSCKKYSLKRVAKKQFSHLVYPALLWGGIGWLYGLLQGDKGSLYHSLLGPWFLWSDFILSNLVAVIHFKFTSPAKRVFGYVIAFAVLIILPGSIEVCKTMNIWMYPYFLTGFLGHGLKIQYRRIIKRESEYIFLVLYPVLICHFHYKHYIYTSGLNPFYSNYGFLEQIWIDIYRWGVGYAGVLFAIIILRILANKIIINRLLYLLFGKLGQVSLQVYVIQWVLVEKFFAQRYKIFVFSYGGGVNLLLKSMGLFNWVWSPAIGLICLFIIFIVIMLIKRSDRANRYLFG